MRKGRRRAAVHRRCWRTSTCTTCSTSGSSAWRRQQAHGDVIVVRYADDFVVGFQHKRTPSGFWTELRERFAKFGLELHPEKTRLIEFGRFAAEQPAAARAREAGDLQLPRLHAHLREEAKNGRFTVLRQTMRKRMQAKLKRGESRTAATHARPIPEVGHVAALGGRRAHPLLRRAHEQPGAARRFGSRSAGSGIARCRGGARRPRARGSGCGGSSTAGCLLPRICHPYPLRRLGVIT